MWWPQLFAGALFVVALMAADDAPEFGGFRKCCPAGQVLVQVDTAESVRYECRETDEVDDDEVVALFGYNLYADREPQMPQCASASVVERLDMGKTLLYATEQCIDRLSTGEVIALQCAGEAGADDHHHHPTITVSQIAKCCADGSVYDLGERSCTDGRRVETAAAFRAELGDRTALLFTVRTPVCADDAEVFVEYLSGAGTHQIGFVGDSSDVVVTSLIGGLQHSERLLAGTFCVDTALDGADEHVQLMVRSCRPRSICGRIPCVRRCCRNEQRLEMINGTSQCRSHERNIRPRFYDVRDFVVGGGGGVGGPAPTAVDVAEYGLIHVQTCPRYILDATYEQDKHYLSHTDGRLHVPPGHGMASFGPDGYCVEFVAFEDRISLETFVCFVPYEQKKFLFYAIGLLMSVAFLAITLIVYLSLPKLMNLHGKTLVCYVASMMVAFLALALAQLGVKEQCYIVAYVIYFGFVSSFCWQSIMCFDIWWTFGSMRMSRGMQKPKEMRRFLLYSLYAWGCPVLLTGVMILFDVYQALPDGWSPTMITDNFCWFGTDNEHNFTHVYMVFFLLPIGVHIIVNSVLFALTARHCSQVKGEIHRMQTQNDEQTTNRVKRKFFANRTVYVMNMKLFIVMGCMWLLEVLASIVQKNSFVWYFTDALNVVHGLLVFFIFVFKWKVWHAIQLRLGFRQAGTPGGLKTNATSTTQLSGGSNVRLDVLAVPKPTAASRLVL